MTAAIQSRQKVDENTWITAIRKGDKTVFSDIYTVYGDQIFAFVMRKCGNRALAEDLTADVFYKAFKNINQCCKATKPNIRARLYMIARNRVIDEFKRSKSGQLNDDIPLQDNQPSVVDTLTTDMLAQQILEYVKTLGEDIHDLFIMRFRQQLSYKEIATINGKTADNNKKIYSRTASKIAERFTSYTH